MMRNVRWNLARTLVLAVSTLLAASERSHAQSGSLSNRGKEFRVGYGHHQFMEPGQTNGQDMVLYFSAEQTANVRVIVKGRTLVWDSVYVVPAGTVLASRLLPKGQNTPTNNYGANVTGLDCRLFDLPVSFGGLGSENIYNRSIHIISDVPIVAYAHIFGSVSSGATMLLPVESWGYSYTSINSYQVDAGGPGYSWCYIIAKEDNTKIEITPSVTTLTGNPANVPFTKVLNKGQIYQFVAPSDAQGNGPQLTGSRIKSIDNGTGNCYPIAVFSGSSRTRGEIACGTGSGRDNDMQQCFPTQTWGKLYLTAPFSTANSSTALNASTFMTSVYKVAIKEAGTVVKRNGVVLTGAVNGIYQFTSNTADVIEADKPIAVAQFISGSSTCNPGSQGDPEMVYLSPLEQSIKRVGFYRNNRQSIVANYVTIIIPTNGVSSLRIDGSSTFNHVYAHPNRPGYSVVVKGWPSAQAQCIVNSDSAFTAVTYGLGSAESYAYNAGAYLNNLSALSQIQNTPDPATPVHQYTCEGTPVKLSVLMAYQPTKLEVLLSSLGTSVTPNTDVILNNPVPTGTTTVNGVPYFKYELSGTYVFSRADTFTIPIRSYHPSIENCYNREELSILVVVKAKPKTDFTYTHSGCTLDPVNLSGTSPTSNGYTVQTFNWTFPGGATATGQNLVRNLPPGVNDVRLSIVTADGCASDTLKQITVYDRPPAQFRVTPNQLCVGTPFTITDTSSASIAVNTWYWDFGNGVTQTVTTGPTVTYTYPTAGTYIIKHVTKSSATCISDTVTRTVTVFHKPTVSFTNNASGCLSPAGLVQFTGTASTPDGQTFSAYNWNFGDPNANGSNPNTATIQNPSHNYQQGTYTIKFWATTANGCVDTSSQVLTFNLKSAISYPALNAVCENAPAFSIASASITNGVTGTGVYSGPGTTAAGQFNPATAGYGTHTIKYVFTSAAGCADSVTQTILVHARPRTNFTIPAGGCLPVGGLIAFTNTTNIPDGQSATWLWNFGDPNASGTNPNTSTLQNPTHNYGDGTYSIKLEATTANGCFKDTTIQATFKVKPALSYAALNAVCENAAAFSVATATVTNGVAGTGVYSGPGTTAAGQFNPALAGYGTHTIKYVFTSTGGCADSITQTILVHARPRTNFTIPTANCLPTSGLVSFTNTTNIPDGQSATWLWNFGDPNANGTNPNTSTLQNPTHNYGEGTYQIKLEATTANGCFKDTTIQAIFKVTPALTYAALAPVCQNVAPFSIASANVTNNVAGTGVYSGPGTSAAGQFDPNAAGPGTHTITYTFTSTGGCVASTTSSIQVYPRPTSTFTLSGTGSVCLGQDITITPTATISSGTITQWNWNLGNGQTPSNTNGNPFTVNYTPAGSYTVQLTTTSNNGCISLPTTQSVTINPLPVADFTLPTTAVCMPGGAATFTNQSTVSGGGTLTYQWSFGDGGTSTQTSPSHSYTSIGNYTVTLVATSAAGCSTQVVKTMSNFVRKPVANFRVSPAELCQGADNQFTDLSAAFNGTLQNWNWNFGDGTTATATNPVKRFAQPGNFNVTLTVTNTAGCVSDPFVTPVIVHLQPVIDAGINYVLQQGTQVTIQATANSPSLTFQWSPAIGLSDPTILNPVLTALQDQTYTLTAIGSFGCRATDQMTLKILKLVTVPNVFSPNGDGIHDVWNIPNLADYPGSTVEVFNRYGQQVFYSIGYNRPWDGTRNGQGLPAGTYYYIVQLKNGFKPLTGSVTILR
jgi:gliding motility-associated-like protein